MQGTLSDRSSIGSMSELLPALAYMTMDEIDPMRASSLHALQWRGETARVSPRTVHWPGQSTVASSPSNAALVDVHSVSTHGQDHECKR